MTLLPSACSTCAAHVGLCSCLQPSQLAVMVRTAKRVVIKAGTVIHTEERPYDKHAIIVDGVVKLSKLLEDGRRQIVGLQFPPDLLGRPHARLSDVTAVAATDTELCLVAPRALNTALDTSLAMQKRLHRQTMDELDEARAWMLTLGRKTAYEKVASILYFLTLTRTAEVISPKNPRSMRLQLPLSRSEIADFLGLTIETVSRQITALRDNELIITNRSQDIIVLDVDRLKIASGHSNSAG